MVFRIKDLDLQTMQFVFPGQSFITPPQRPKSFRWEVVQQEFATYQEQFDQVMEHLLAGNSYLVNLTSALEVKTDASLQDIFFLSNAPYKGWIKNQFSVFSPEPFVTIADDSIATFPMKGTMESGDPYALNKLLADPKEMAEHSTVVDLLRNDLARISSRVRVDSFRQPTLITTEDKTFYQTSSKIVGELTSDWHGHVGDLLYEIFPPGSVTGAPKIKTISIIKEIEKINRGYYCGIMGHYDGVQLESAVMIRYVENLDGKLLFRAGGGITHLSKSILEYEEIKLKCRLPIGDDIYSKRDSSEFILPSTAN